MPPMLYTNIQTKNYHDSGKKKITIHGQGGHFGQWRETIEQTLYSLFGRVPTWNMMKSGTVVSEKLVNNLKIAT